MKVLHILCFIIGVYGQSDVYWGSYELNIPGGSGSGNAVKDLKLPENAPEFFQFAAFNSQPFAAPQFAPVVQSPPQAAPQPAPLRVQEPRPSVPQPAPQAVQPAPLRVQQQARPAAPQPQQLRVFQARPVARQQQRQRPTQSRQLAQQPAPRVPAPVQGTQSSPRFQNFAPRTVERPAPSAVQTKAVVPNIEVNEVVTNEEVPVDISKLSRFQLYKLRQKLKQQKDAKLEKAEPATEVVTENSVVIQETTLAAVKVVPKRARTGIRRKAVRRKLVRNNA